MIIDLIYVISPDERTMQVAIMNEDGTSQRLGPVPSTGSFGPLGVALAQLKPEIYPDASEATTALTILHFQNMARHANRAGQPYPHVISAPA